MVDHVAGATIDGKTPAAAWLAGMQDASRHENVFIKVSALAEGAARSGKPAPADVDYYRPTLGALWTLFGDDRLMYGSNWPVCERAGDYATVIQIVRTYVDGRGKESQRKFFAGTAGKAYQWVNRGG